MYPVTCKGGFFVPARKGMMRVLGVQATVADLTADARVALIDDEEIKHSTTGFIYGTDPTYVYPLIDIQAQADQEGKISEWYSEPIVFRYGISVGANTTNISTSSLKVFVR